MRTLTPTANSIHFKTRIYEISIIRNTTVVPLTLIISGIHCITLKVRIERARTNGRSFYKHQIIYKVHPYKVTNIQSVAKHQKIGGRKNFYFRKKNLNAEKTERGDSLGFFNIHSVAKQQKIEGGPFGEKFSEKSLAVPKRI